MYKMTIRKMDRYNGFELEVGDDLRLAVKRFKIESMRFIDTLTAYEELIESVWIDKASIYNRQLAHIIIDTKTTRGYNSYIIDFYEVD